MKTRHEARSTVVLSTILSFTGHPLREFAIASTRILPVDGEFPFDFIRQAGFGRDCGRRARRVL
eukprot:jgi/Botrbrau1/7477/Bobra.0095s0015.1